MRYYANINSQETGEHEIHCANCTHLPDDESRIYLGDFVSCKHALHAARQIFALVNGCFYCTRECHKG